MAKPVPRLDPYLVWWALAQAQAPQAKPGDREVVEWLHVLVETRKPDIPYLLDLQVLPVHLHATGANGSRPVRFVSALVDDEGLKNLLIESQKADSPIVRFELAEPRDRLPGTLNQILRKGEASLSASEANAPDTLPEPGALAQVLKGFLAAQLGLATPRDPKRPATPPAKPRPLLVGVVDDRFNAHCSAFASQLDAGTTTMWHQGGRRETLDLLKDWDSALSAVWAVSPGPLVPVLYPKSMRGTFVGRRPPTTASYRSALPGDAGMASYLRLRVQWPPPFASHGSAILDLIGGPALWTGRRRGTPDGVIHRVTNRPQPQRLHLVQLAIPTVVDTAGGSLAAAVLDGIHDVLDHAQPGANVIVNVSFGTHSGGHDGTSMLESAILELLNLYNGESEAQFKTLHVVLPIGNSHTLRCHASGICRPAKALPATSCSLLWKVQPDNATDTFMEIWIPAEGDVRVELKSPDGEVSHVEVKGKGTSTVHKRSGAVVGAVVAPARPTQGMKGRMVLLAIGATADTVAPLPWSIRMSSLVALLPVLGAGLAELHSGMVAAGARAGMRRALAPHGVWTVRLKAIGAVDVPFHAWIMRADTAPLRGRASQGHAGRQSHFLDAPDAGVDPRFTLNGIASFSHPNLFTVGAMRQSDHCPSGLSAAGPGRDEPQRCEGPDIVVHADASRSQPGLLVAGFHGGARYRVPGTSVAAAAVTRHLYEHLARGGTAATFLPRPHQYEACHSAAFDGACKDRIPAGAPEQAHPMHRGIWRRAVPSQEDGSL